MSARCPRRPCKVLEQTLTARRWLGGADRFTAADLHVAAVLAWQRNLGQDLLTPFPRTREWLFRCIHRPLSPDAAEPIPIYRRHGVEGVPGRFPTDDAAMRERYARL